MNYLNWRILLYLESETGAVLGASLSIYSTKLFLA